ncbi:MAG: DNA internalization-related competence protein ComEC/Rec2 [Acidobacteriota bacterium]|nr:DNA internalization-related competence protein ComEC/Rec2 [Acidobacteriota bacterium]
MRVPAIPVLCALVTGACAAFYLPGSALPWVAAAALAAWQLALVAFVSSRLLLFAAAALASIALSAAAAASHEDWSRRHVPVRALAPSDPRVRADPVILDGVLLEDAAPRGDAVGLRLDVARVRWGRAVIDVTGGVALSVTGASEPARVREWTRGRRVRVAATLRRPGRHLNDGVADAEVTSIRRGIALVGTVKSAALVDVLARGSPWDEASARLRRRVRASVAAAIATDPEAAAIVTAILIGDRAGLPEELERRLQRAGTYHVIAISGGNIALFAMLAWGVARALVAARRLSIVSAMTMIAAYGLLVGAGASVGRAVTAALLFFAAALAGHRTPPLNVIAVVGILFLLWDPLALADVGFLLSFGATAGILIATPAWLARVDASRRVARMALAVILATVAAEIVLLPIQATAFHRVTIAGLALNLVAIPAMSVVQVAGMAVVLLDVTGMREVLGIAAAAARLAARSLADSAGLVDLAPWLAWRVAAPPLWLSALYAALCLWLAWGPSPRLTRGIAGAAVLGGVAIAMSAPARVNTDSRLRLTMFDVGQAESIVLRLPSGRSLLVDAAGPRGRFDIADRVLVPALLARGVTRLDALVLTHPDLDHLGGALGVIADLRPARLLEGVAPVRHVERQALVAAAARAGLSVEALRAGGSLLIDGVRINVLHPPPPEWERQRVRNDDSLVLEVLFGDVAIILTGDAGEAVEPGVAAALSRARVRILKAGHHGSRTSTSAAFLDAVRPQAALISAGRGNIYGHPSPGVTDRLRAAGAAVFRTDQDGQIDLVTDGSRVDITTWSGRAWSIAARPGSSGRDGG